MWVGFAGPYFELFLWSLAIFVWRMTEPLTLVHSVATIIIATSGIKTLLNFNPMIKWDGYYLLSDWLGIPNLRTKAFRYVGNKIKWLWGGAVASAQPIPLRERRILLMYGLIAVIGSVSLLVITIVTVGVQLVEKRQSLALFVFVGLLGDRVRRRFLRLFGKSSNDPSDPDDDMGDTEEEATPRKQSLSHQRTTETATTKITHDSNMTKSAYVRPPTAVPSKEGSGHSVTEADTDAPRREQPARVEKSKRPARRRLKNLAIRILKLTVVAGAAAAILFFARSDLRVPGDFNVLPVRTADVRAEVEGIIEEVTVREGQLVQVGDPVARLSEHELRAELERITAQIEENRSRLKLLEAGARPEEIQLAQIAVARAEEQLKFKRSRAGRDRQLYEEQLLSLNDYEESKRQVAELESDLSEAKRKLELLLAGNRLEEIQAMKAAVASLEAQRKFTEDQMHRGHVVSLAAGIVTTPELQLKELEHQLVKKGDLIAKVHDFQTITALIGVSEKEIADVHVGQSVRLKARAYPEMVFDGKVTEIATTAQAANSSPTTIPTSSTATTIRTSPNTILVTSEIDNHAGYLKPGMTGMAKISCGEHRLLDLAKRRLSRTLRVEFWSWW
jgi:multidrug resistance efflux pump